MKTITEIIKEKFTEYQQNLIDFLDSFDVSA